MLGFSISKEELKVFMDELDEQLQSLESHLLSLEKGGTPEGIKELFRIAHTVKGSAASIGYDSMAKMTHAMESAMDGVRQGRITVNRELIDLLFRALDALKKFKRNLSTGSTETIDTKDLQERLEAVAKKEPKQQQAAASLSAPGASAQLKPGEFLYEVCVRFAADCDMPAVRAFQTLLELEKLGEVLQSAPTPEELKAGMGEFSEFLLSFKSKSEGEPILKALQSVSEISDVKLNKTSEGKTGEAEQSKSEGDITQELKASRTIRVSVDVFDTLMNLVGELVIDKTRLISLGADLQARAEGGIFGQEILDATLHLDKITSELQEHIMKARLVPIDLIFKKFPRMMRDLSARSNKPVDFRMIGEDTQLDRSVIEEIIDPLIHLLRNSLDHGIEPADARVNAGKRAEGLIELRAYHQENHVVIEVADDGGGIDADKVKARALERGIVSREDLNAMSRAELIDLIFLPGFSTAEKVTDVSGRGVGMDIVKATLQRIGGSLEIQTEVGKGTTFVIKIPLTLAILQGLMVSSCGTVFAIPLSSVREIVRIEEDQIKTMGGREVFVLRGNVVPLVSLGELYHRPMTAGKGIYSIVVVSHAERLVGIHVDELLRKQEVVIKTIGSYIGDVSGIAGATVLGDGTVALILDVSSYVNLVSQSRRTLRQVS